MEEQQLEQLMDDLLVRLSDQVARGVATGIARSGLMRKVEALSPDAARSAAAAADLPRVKRPRRPARRSGAPCIVEGCDHSSYAKGMCGKHFMEWVRSQKKP